MPSALQVSNLSYEDLLADLQGYVKTRPGLEGWLDFYASGAGETLLELLAGFATYLSAHSMLARRESYLDTARLRSSLVKIAGTFGYNVNRVSAPILKLTVDYTGDDVYWRKEDAVIGSWNGRPLALVESLTITTGTNIFSVYVGEWKSITPFTAADAIDFYRYDVEDSTIDNELDRIILRMDDQVVPLVKYPEELAYDYRLEVQNEEERFALTTSQVQVGDRVFQKEETPGSYWELIDASEIDNELGWEEVVAGNALIRTTPGGTLILFGDGVLGRRLFGELVELTYLSTEGKLGVNSVAIGEASISIGSLTAIEILSYGYDEDSKEKIAALTPGYYAARRAMVSAKDHTNMLLSYAGSLVSAGARKKPGQCCTVEMCYLFSDEHIALGDEQAMMLDYLNRFKMVGETIELSDPVRVGLTMRVTVVATRQAIEDDLQTKVYDVVNSHMKKLGGVFYVGEITQEIASIDGVLRVYLQNPSSDRVLEYNQFLSVDSIVVNTTTDVRAVFTFDPDNSGYSDQVSPSNIIEIEVHLQDEDSVTLNWAPSSNHLGYVLERSMGVNSTAYVLLAQLSSISESYQDEALPQGQTYNYRLRAVNQYGSSSYIYATIEVPPPSE